MSKNNDYINESGNYNKLGMEQAALNNLEKAIEYFKKAIEIDSNNVNALHNCADLLNSKNQFKEALEIYTTLCNTHPETGFYWYNKAISEFGLKKNEDGQYSLNKAYELNPSLRNVSCGIRILKN